MLLTPTTLSKFFLIMFFFSPFLQLKYIYLFICECVLCAHGDCVYLCTYVEARGGRHHMILSLVSHGNQG